MLRKLGVLALMLILVTVVEGASYGKIRGIVTDAATGDPLWGANVVVQGTNLGAATDEDGYFIIFQVPIGQYTLVANMIGYTSMEVTEVFVMSKLTTTVDFRLSTTTIEGETVTVTAKRDVIKMDLAASQTNATKEEIVHMPFSNDIESYMDSQAGMDGWSIRGGGIDQVGFAIDGLSMVDNAFNQPINMVNMSFVDEVSVIKGGFNAEYGNIRSGMIEVTTEEGAQEYHGSYTMRYSPSRVKHSGHKITDPRSWWHRPYLDPETRENGTSGVLYTSEFGEETNYNSYFDRFEGWGGDTNFVDWENAMLSYIWDHCIDGYDEWDIPDAADLRKEAGLSGKAADPLEYGHLPDVDMEFSLSGPVPVIGGMLGDATFVFSIRDEKVSYAFPSIRDYYHVTNTNSKITSYIGQATKLNIEYLRQEEYSLIEEDWGSLMGPYNDYDPYVYAQTPGEAVRNGFGIGIDHTINNRSFWQFRLAGVNASIFADGPHTFRNEGTAADTIHYFEDYGVTEAPYGFSQFPHRLTAFGSGYIWAGVGASVRNDSKISTMSARFDYTNQINRTNEIKAGVFFNYDDFNANFKIRDFDITGNTTLIFKANPYRGAAYIQDKIEHQGMIANVGLRLEFTNPNTEWYKLDVDSLIYSKYFAAAYKNDFDEAMVREKVKPRVKLSPRIGLSHPLTESSKIYFNYGHDYSMPPTMDMYIVDYTRPGWPIASIGNPSLDIPRTIRYELGFDQELFDQYLISVVAYYRDISDEVGDVMYENTTGSVGYSKTVNNHYADVRGFELTLEKRWGQFFTGFVNYTFLSTKDGFHGREVEYEDPIAQRLYGFRNPVIEQPLPTPYLNANVRLMTPDHWGMATGMWSVSTNVYWSRGDFMTWEPVGRVKRAQNNVRWRDEFNMDMRIDKRLDVGGIEMELYADIFNVLNIQRMTGDGFKNDTDMRNYYNSLHLDEYNKEKYEGTSFVGGNDRPGDIWSEDKDYIDMPNIDLNRLTMPRALTFGIEFGF